MSNAGKLPVTDVVVRCQLPVELGFTGATEGGRLEGREVVWTPVSTLQPDEAASRCSSTATGKVADSPDELSRSLSTPRARADAGPRLGSGGRGGSRACRR